MPDEPQALPSEPTSPPLTFPVPAEAPRKDVNYYLTNGEKTGKIIAFIAGADFILGYMSLAYGAYRNKLGFIPPLQAQCLLAGFVPTVLFGIIIVIGLTRSWVAERIVQWVRKPYTQNGIAHRHNILLNVLVCTVVAFIIFALYIVYVLIAHKTSVFLILARFPIVPAALVYVLFVTLAALIKHHLLKFHEEGNIDTIIKDAVTSTLVKLDRNDLSAEDLINSENFAKNISLVVEQAFRQFVPDVHRKQVLFYQAWLAITVTIVWPSFFVSLPQEFGGMRPRYAYADVKKDSLSVYTRKLLLPAPCPDAVCRTLPLAVYYENDGTLFVRPVPNGTNTPVQEIKKDAIEGVTWLGYDPPKK